MSSEKRMTILLVEDQALIALAEKLSLEGCGYAVLTAKSGEAAVAMAMGNAEIDLIFMDIDLGEGMDGIAAAEIIQKDRDTPIVFLSSHKEIEIARRGDRVVSYGYIAKPSGIAVLDATIRAALALFSARPPNRPRPRD
jgi:CheY-like chemotaxis protein